MQSEPFGVSSTKSLKVLDSNLIFHLSRCLLHQNVRLYC